MYTLITDGAYSPMRNQGGVGIIILDNEGHEVLEYSKTFKDTTSQQMEVMACIIGLESISEPEEINVITDSSYLIGCASLGWQRRKNVELWDRYDKIAKFHKSIKFNWQKGHADHEYNNRCDKLAVTASQKKL